jgi:hypothetical protein
VADVPKRFANHSDFGRLVQREFSRRLYVQRKSRPRPIENRLAYLTPRLLTRHFTHDNSRLFAGGISQRQMKVAVCFDFHSDYTSSKSVPIILAPGAL